MTDRLAEIKAKRKGRDAKYYGGFGWDIDDIDWLIARIEELSRAFAQVQEAKIITEKRWLSALDRAAEVAEGFHEEVAGHIAAAIRKLKTYHG